MSADIKILLVGEQEQSMNHLRGILNSFDGVEMISHRDLKSELDRLAPDLIFLVESDNESPVDAIEYIHAVNPLAIVVFIAFSQNFDVLKSVMRAGINDFFVLPDENAMFYGRLDSIIQMVVQRKKQLVETAVSSQSFKRGRGKIFSFYSGKGGSGKTLISSAFAQTLKFESTAQVIFIDLNLHYGGAETYLSIASNRSLADLMPVIDELNESHIRNVSQIEKLSKLEVLLSPRDAEVAEHLPEGFISRLLRTCRRSYDFVIVDLPVAMNIHSYGALEESDKIFYVLNLDTPSINTLKQVEVLFQRLGIVMEGRMEILINQVGKENEIKPQDVKNLLAYPIVAKLPRDLKGVQSRINKSETFRKEPNEKKLIPFAKGIRKWVVQMVE